MKHKTLPYLAIVSALIAILVWSFIATTLILSHTGTESRNTDANTRLYIPFAGEPDVNERNELDGYICGSGERHSTILRDGELARVCVLYTENATYIYEPLSLVETFNHYYNESESK